MNQILHAVLREGDGSLIAAGILAHPRSHQLTPTSIDKTAKFASGEILVTDADLEGLRALGRGFLMFDGEHV